MLTIHFRNWYLQVCGKSHIMHTESYHVHYIRTDSGIRIHDFLEVRSF